MVMDCVGFEGGSGWSEDLKNLGHTLYVLSVSL